MAKSIQDILGSKNVVGVFEGIKAGFPTDLPQGFYNVSRNVNGAHFTYHKVEGTRKTARVVRYGGPSAARNHSGVDEVPVKALFSAEHWDVDPVTLINISALGNDSVQQIGISEIARRLAEEKQLQQNLRNTAVHMAVLDGTLYTDAVGNLLPTSSGAVLTIDYSIPATNKNQLQDVDGNTIITASWGTAGTDIPGQVRLIKTTALKRTGYNLTTAIYGSNVLGYLLGNTDMVNLMQSNVRLGGIADTGELPSPLLGLNWIPGDVFFWEDNDGSTRSLVGADEVVFLPDPDPSWYDLVEGSYPYADSIDVNAGEAAISGLRMQSGMSVQSKLMDNPVTAQMIHRDCFLPVINVPGAIYIADVTP
jgi:hypothetical protein